MKPKLIQLLLLGLFAGASWADEGAPETDRTWEYNGYYTGGTVTHLHGAHCGWGNLPGAALFRTGSKYAAEAQAAAAA